MVFQQHVALVSGAGSESGIGLAIARRLGRAGARILLTASSARVEQRAAELCAEGIDARAKAADLTDQQQVAELLQWAQAQWGQIDILVNNAGVPPGMPNALRTFKDLVDEDFERQLDLNLRAILGLTRLVVGGMCERGFGRIVIITSESWRNGMSMGLSNYAAAKSAALGFMRHLAHEVGREGVTANALSLGAMNNFGYDEIAKRNTAVGRAGTADDVGAAVAYLVSNEASWMSGQVIALNGGSCTA